jgi:16S rRNA (cytosine967-C5)-methyltransferase
MKLHRNLVVAVISGLKDILLDKKQADTTVGNLLLSNKSWGSRDRNFIADNIYNIVRYKRLYEFCLGDELFGEASLWKLLGTKLLLESVVLPDWKEFSELKQEDILSRVADANATRKIRESIPDWLDELGEKELGKEWDKEIAALNKPATFSIRVNTLRTNTGIIKRMFADEGIEFSETSLAPDALIIHSRKNFRNHAAYKNGLFEIQDVSSQLVSIMLAPQAGMNVIDGCAGAGGKTLHMAALMQNKGEILAVDVRERRLDELERRATRAGCKIVKPMLAERLTRHHQALMRAFADRILLDVPCSGLGVLRRKPDAKWTLTPKFLAELQQTQSQILDEYASMLKKDGILVYSTCSILPSENEQQVKQFLARNKGYELEEEKRISPAESGFDGFYMAKLKRV